MSESDNGGLPKFESLDELVEFFDTHDLGDYWEKLPEVNFEVDIQQEIYLFSLDAELAGDVIDVARSKQLSPQELINLWIREKLMEQV